MSKAIVTDGSINGFLFDIVGKIQHDLDSDSTDHYVEDNTAVQDHIALKPEKITLVYYHGEVSDVSNNITSVKKKELQGETNIKVLVEYLVPIEN